MDRIKCRVGEAKAYHKRYTSVACNMMDRVSFMNTPPVKSTLFNATKHWRYNCN